MSVSNSLVTKIEVEKKDVQIWIKGTQLPTSRTFNTHLLQCNSIVAPLIWKQLKVNTHEWFRFCPYVEFQKFWWQWFSITCNTSTENGKAICKNINYENLISQDVIAFTSLSHLKKQFLQILRLLKRLLCLEQPLGNLRGIFF